LFLAGETPIRAITMKTSMTVRSLFALVGLAGVGLVLTGMPSSAVGVAPNGLTRYYNASSCQVASGTPLFSDGQIQNNGSTTMVLLCPIQRDQLSSASFRDVTAITLDAWCNSFPCEATACLSHQQGGAKTCTSGNLGGGVIGVAHFAPMVPAMTAADYLYVEFSMTPGSALFGYHASQSFL
jgi:hypothetical protein